ncbi:MAG: glucuronate isomerase [Vicinamibacterales bacterium]
MVPFITPRFLLHSKAAQRLYDTYAATQPIIDYHNHLPPQDIAQNRRFENLFEIWLEGDHYKWRAMRANGIEERFITGDASPYEKFLAWARTVPRCLRNPLYHWTHLELARYFGIDDLLDETTAPDIWRRANERLASDDLTTHGILRQFKVKALCTTDDPAEPLNWHTAIRGSGLETAVYPTFRPDRAMDVHLPDVFNPWLDKLAAVSDVDIVRLDDLLDALRARHQAFHDVGGRLSDHGLAVCPADPFIDAEVAATFDRARSGRGSTPQQARAFASSMMVFFAHLDADQGWTKQLHLGALRNVNGRALQTLGRDGGFDSIGDWPQAEALGTYLNRLNQEGALPRVIVYNVNPSDNYTLATMIGNFQDGSLAGRIQFGSAWWFVDQKEGIEWQLNALSNAGLLAHFVGMLTDSRSFMSYPRHEYFRRVLCNLLGTEMENGELPDDDGLVGKLVEDVSFGNASRYFGWG